MAKICGKCGHLNDDAYNYCANCSTPLGAEVTVVSKEEVERLRNYQAELRSIKQRGYAPEGTRLVGTGELRTLDEARTELNNIRRQGYAPEGYVIIDKSEYDTLKTTRKWLWGIGIALVLILVSLLLKTLLSNGRQSSSETTVEDVRYRNEYPSEIKGSYIVRMMNGRQLDIRDEFITAEIYQEGEGYAMNLYSNGITQKYVFSYNPSNGELYSNELGRGQARIIELTNETEITFEGWILVI